MTSNNPFLISRFNLGAAFFISINGYRSFNNSEAKKKLSNYEQLYNFILNSI